MGVVRDPSPWGAAVGEVRGVPGDSWGLGWEIGVWEVDAQGEADGELLPAVCCVLPVRENRLREPHPTPPARCPIPSPLPRTSVLAHWPPPASVTAPSNRDTPRMGDATGKGDQNSDPRPSHLGALRTRTSPRQCVTAEGTPTSRRPPASCPLPLLVCLPLPSTYVLIRGCHLTPPPVLALSCP